VSHAAGTRRQNAHEAAQKLAESKIIESARANLIQLHQAVLAIPNDTYFANQWNLRNTGQTMSDGNAGTAGAACGGAVKVIACIEDAVVIEKILTHLNEKALPIAAPLLPESRAPPQAGWFD
jgi:hypothetical protein